MHVLEAVSEPEFITEVTDVPGPARVAGIHALLSRYATEARKYPLLSHAAFVEHSRTLYSHHYQRLCCLSQLPAIIESIVALNVRRQAGKIRWSTFVCSVGDQSPQAKDAVLEGYRRSRTPIPPSGYLDTSVSRDDEAVEQCLDDLQLLHESFTALPLEQRLGSDGQQIEAIAAVARRINLRWDTLTPLLNQFIEITDEFAAAKRALVAAAAGESAESAAVVVALCDRFLLTAADPTDTLVALVDGHADPHQLAQRIAAPLAKVRELEARHSRLCEVVLELRRHYDRADQAVRLSVNEIVLRNLLLVLKEVNRHAFRDDEVFDAIQEGNEGLAEAAVRFRYWAGTRFSTYAAFWINQRLQRLRVTTHSMFAIPVGIVLENTEIQQVRRRLTRANGGRPPSDRELAAAMNIDVAKVQRVDAAYSPHLGSEAIDDLHCEEHTDQEETVSRSQLEDLVRKALHALPQRDADILRLRFGIDRPAATLRDISEMYGLSGERVRRLEKLSIARLLRGPFARELRLFLA
jgi:RNA polymerase primary sigma factor